MFLDIDGNQVFTLDFGTGPEAFLAHSGWIGNFEDWIAALAPLSRQWRTVIYDHRGAGETKVPVEKITPQALVDDLFEVMARLGIEKCILGGFSLGTSTVLHAVLQHPHRFTGLVLMNGAAGVQDPSDPAPPRVPPSHWPGGDFHGRLRWFVERCTPEPDVEYVRQWAFDILSRAEPDVADRLATMAFEDAPDWEEVLPQIKIPVLLIHGEKDPLVQLSAMRYLEALLPNARLEVLKDTGHLPAMTRPQTIAQLIGSYFRESRT